MSMSEALNMSLDFICCYEQSPLFSERSKQLDKQDLWVTNLFSLLNNLAKILVKR